MQCLGIPQRTCYGNSRFPVGSDGPHRGGKERQLRYNSRTLAGRDPHGQNGIHRSKELQLSRPLRGQPEVPTGLVWQRDASTHAPRAGVRHYRNGEQYTNLYALTHAPRKERGAMGLSVLGTGRYKRDPVPCVNGVIYPIAKRRVKRREDFCTCQAVADICRKYDTPIICVGGVFIPFV